MRNGPTIEVADQELGQPLALGAPGPLRKSVGDEERGAAHHEQHAERDQERRDFQPRDEEAVDAADQRGDDECDDERDLQRRDAGC